MKPERRPEPAFASFRDPAGRVCRLGDRIVRIVENSATASLSTFLASDAATQLVAKGALVRSRLMGTAEADEVLDALALDSRTASPSVVEHERIPFPSFPYEWPAEMLAAAGRLTLDIADALLDEGFGLKDATPYNVLFRGPNPVFVDVLSAESRDPGNPTWLPYAQFIRMFVLPLLLHRTCGIPSSLYLADRRDGIEPEEVYRLLPFFAKFQSPALTQVTLPALLTKFHNPSNTKIYGEKQAVRNAAQSRFILKSIFRSLRRNLEKVSAGVKRKSAWTGYMETLSYSEQAFEGKRAFVEKALQDCSPSLLLDVGCNTGFFSIAAAKAGASVVALDTDPLVVGRVWKAAHENKLDILPLVVNLARPTPPIGWRNQEYQSFLDRARGQFDAVLMLAVIHHMMASEGIPLAEIFSLARDLSRQFLIIEYVDPGDPMFKQLLRGREALFANLSRTTFEATARQFFDIVLTQPLDSTRCMYVMVKI